MSCVLCVGAYVRKYRVFFITHTYIQSYDHMITAVRVSSTITVYHIASVYKAIKAGA